MKNILIIMAALLSLQSTAQRKENKLQDFVFDYAQNFTPAQSDSLQKLLKDHYKKTGDEIVVVTTDSLGGTMEQFGERFGASKNIGNQNTIKSVLIILSIRGKTFGMLPNGVMQEILTQQVLDKIKLSGLTELKAHQFFQGVWKECKGLLDFLKDPENRGKIIRSPVSKS